MITNLDRLCKAHFLASAIEANFSVDIGAFTDELNNFIHGYGGLFYDEADAHNLRTARKYTPQEAQEFLRQVQETRKFDKCDYRIVPIDEVPVGIALDLAKDLEGGAYTIRDARSGTYNFGVMRGYELVGFVSGKQFKDHMSLGGLFVREDFRSKGISKLLLLKMMEVAQEDGMRGLSMGNASWAGQGALASLKRHLDKTGISSSYEAGSEDLKNYAILTFE